MRDDLIPSEARIFGWIEQVFAQGVRRPGYPADRWAEEWIACELAALGLENVRREPVELPYWEPRRARPRLPAAPDRGARSTALRSRTRRPRRASRRRWSRSTPRRPSGLATRSRFATSA
jgi:hypothetical protein